MMSAWFALAAGRVFGLPRHCGESPWSCHSEKRGMTEGRQVIAGCRTGLAFLFSDGSQNGLQVEAVGGDKADGCRFVEGAGGLEAARNFVVRMASRNVDI